MSDRELEDALNNELQTGEELLWRAQPEPWRMAKTTLPMFLFAIPWTLFALAWETMALGGVLAMLFQGGESGLSGIGAAAFALVFPIFGLPFIVIGFGMLGTPWWAYKAAQRTVFAITSRRALIITLWWRRSFESYENIDPSHIHRVEDSNGNGDLFFRRETRISGGDETTKEIGFHGVRQVRRVEEVLRDMISDDAREG